MNKFRKVVVIAIVVFVGFYILADLEGFNLDKGPESVSLFYYDSSLDMDEDGNVLCSEKGLVEVKRLLESESDAITDTVNMLVSGVAVENLDEVETVSNFPLEGFELESSSLEKGVLSLEFNDPNFNSSGGSCKSTILFSQLMKTVNQFEEVESVSIGPDHVFQP